MRALRRDCGDGARACGRCPYGADGDGESVDAGADVRWLLRTSGVRDYNDVALSLTFAMASQSFRKTMAAELSGGGTEVSSEVIGRVFHCGVMLVSLHAR